MIGGLVQTFPSSPTITDNQGGGWTIDKFGTPAAGGDGETLLASRPNITNAGTFTISVTPNSGAYIAYGAIAFSGAAASAPLDVLSQVSYDTPGVSASSFNTAVSAATVQADEVAIAIFSLGNQISIGSLSAVGYTTPVASLNGAADAVGGMAFRILSSTGTQQATFNLGIASGIGTQGYNTIIATYKGAANVATYRRHTTQRQQPQQATPIDWSNPITRGLAFAYLPGLKWDSSGRYGMATLATGSSAAQGTSIVTDGSTTYPGIITGSGPLLGGLANSTCVAVAARYRGTANLGSNGDAIYSERSTLGTNDIYKIGWGTPLNNPLDAEFVYRDDAGTLLFTWPPMQSTQTTDNAAHFYAAVKNGTSHSMFADYSKVTATFGAATTPFTDAGIVRSIGNDAGDGASAWDGRIDLVAGWTRSLSDTEIASLRANPWQIFKAPSKSYSFPVLSAPLVSYVPSKRTIRQQPQSVVTAPGYTFAWAGGGLGDVVSGAQPSLAGTGTLPTLGVTTYQNNALRAWAGAGGANGTGYLNFGNAPGATDMLMRGAGNGGTAHILFYVPSVLGSGVESALMCKGDNNGSHGWVLYIAGSAGGMYAQFIPITPSNPGFSTFAGSITVGWNLLTMTTTGDNTPLTGQFKMYVNGAGGPCSEFLKANSTLTDAAYPLLIGNNQPSFGAPDFFGYIALVAFAPRQLSAGEVLAVAQNPWSIFKPVGRQYFATAGTSSTKAFTFALSEALVLSYIATRSRALSSAVSESEVIAAPIVRARPLAASIAETETDNITPQRMRGVPFAVAETETDSTAFTRARKASFAVAETEAVAEALARKRIAAFAVAETETWASVIGRSRPATFSVAETEADTLAISRARAVATSIVETLAYSFTLAGAHSKTFTMTIAEVEAQVASFARARKVTFTQAELEAIAVQTLSRARAISAAVAESEAIASSVGRGRPASFTIAETETDTAALNRSRAVAASIVETLAYSFTLFSAHSKVFTMTIAEVESQVSALARARNVVFSQAEIEALTLQTIARARTLATTINETETVSATLRRLRIASVAIAETEGVQSAINRVRNVLNTITEATGITFTVETHGLEVESVFVTVSWDEWNVIASGALQMTHHTEQLVFHPKVVVPNLTVTDQQAATLILSAP